MDEKEKRETLANLYALRGGLSVVSEIKDDINDKLWQLQITSQNNINLVQTIQDKLKAMEKPRIDSIPYRYESTKYHQESIITSDKKISKYKNKIVINCIIAVVAFIIFIIAEKSWFNYIYKGVESVSIFENIVAILLAPSNLILVVVGLFIYFLCCDVKDLKWEIKSKNIRVNDMQVGESMQKSNQEKYKKELEKYNTQKTELEKQLAAQKADSEKNIAESSVESVEYINERKEFGNALLEVLEDNYSHLLDKRDWANLDLFIYFYETDRADSKKEALQLIDQYNQNQNIVQAINNAGREVCLTINQGLGKLNNTIINCFDSLSTQLYNMHTTTMQKLNSIENDMQYVSEYLGGFSSSLAGLKESIDFNNALKEKANETSAKLADDVNYIRTIDEIEEVRKRSGCKVSY